MPVIYANLVESMKEIRRLTEEKRNKRKIGDIEGREQTQFDEETPLAGRGFARDGNGAYVWTPATTRLGGKGVARYTMR